MRCFATFTLLATFGAAVVGGAGRPCEASAARRAYFRAVTADARARVAPFGARALPGGIVSAEIPPALLPTLSAAPGLTFLGYEGLFQPVPIPAEESAQGGARPQAAADTRRYCWPPATAPVGWGIKAMYDDPNLVQPSGGAGVKVGLIDTGVYPHLDIVRRLVKCVNVAPPDTLAPCTDIWPSSHGTMTASVIAADGGADGLGMWGMAPEASIYSYRVCEPNRECWGAYVADAVYAAIADGVNIINMSLAGPGNDDVVRAAIDDAVAHNILVVVAAGNSPPYSYVGYPAAYPEVVSVGAIRENLQPWPFTASGVNDGDYVREYNEIEVAAPGDKVLVATKVGCWGILPGTSLAAPMVTGLAAKLWNGDAAATRARIQRAARFRDLHVAGDDTLSGFGLPTIRDFSGSFVINAAAGPRGTISPSGGVALSPGVSQTFTIQPSDNCFAIENVKVDGASLGPVPSYTFADVRSDHTIEATFSSEVSFTITASAGPAGTIIPSGVSRVACGSSMRYAFAGLPDCGQIKDVIVDGLSLGTLQSYTFTNVRSDHTIEARFSAAGATYSITAAAGSGGSISPSGVSNVPCGGSQTYSITPSGGCGAYDVKVDGLSKGAISTYTFDNVLADHNISVTFNPGPFSITASASAGGTISPSGVTSVACGGSQTYTITRTVSCAIQDVRVDGVSQGAIPSYTFTNVLANHTISVTFAGPFTITASAGPGGTISPNGATGVACGGSQSYTITRSGACASYDVMVDGSSQGPLTSYTFTNVQANHTISATFTGTFKITGTAGHGGSIAPTGSKTYPCGYIGYYTIYPSTCYRTQDVKVDGVSQGPIWNYTFLWGSHTIVASFAPLGPYSIDVSAGPGGTISPGSSASVGCAAVQTYTFKPIDNCHVIQDVIVDGVSVGPRSTYMFNPVTASHTVQAIFSTLGPYTIDVSAGAGGTISPGGAASVACGENRTYTIASDECHRIQDVKVDGLSRGPITSFRFLDVRENHAIVAAFAELGPFAIDASAGPGGTISPKGESSAACGASLSYSIAANGCHAIQDVKVDGVSQGPVASFTFPAVTAAHSIEATFSTLGPYTITASAGEGATISPAGPASVVCGASLSYQIAPDACRALRDVLVDGVSVGALTGYTFADVRGDHTIAATSAPGMTLSETHAGASWVSDGMVDLTVTGGVPPYAYAWSNGASSQDLGGLAGGTYDVRVTDSQGCVGDLEVTIVSDLPTAVALGHPAPNPSAGAVRMRYAIPAATAVRLSVLDLQGREVAVLADGTRAAGWSWADWNGATRDGRAPGGMYFIRLQAGGRQIVQRFALVR